MNVKELIALLEKYPEETLVGIYEFDECCGELLKLSTNVEEGFTDKGDIPVIYIW